MMCMRRFCELVSGMQQARGGCELSKRKSQIDMAEMVSTIFENLEGALGVPHDARGDHFPALGRGSRGASVRSSSKGVC